jgi:hypothetical protein
MDESLKKAFDFAADVTKQLITLSTGIVGATITFFNFLSTDVPDSTRRRLFYAWCAYFMAIVFGIWTLLALTGSLSTRAFRSRH